MIIYCRNNVEFAQSVDVRVMEEKSILLLTMTTKQVKSERCYAHNAMLVWETITTRKTFYEKRQST